MFSGIRNAITISIMLIAFPLLRDRKPIPYFVLALFAMFIHTSAMIYMPLAYLIGSCKPMSKRESYIWIIAMLLFQAIPLHLMIQRFFPYVNLLFHRYNRYVLAAEQLGESRTLLDRFSIMVSTVAMVWFMRTTNLNKNENIVGRLALIYSMSGLLGGLAGRMTQNFVLFFVSANTLLISKWKEKDLRYVYVVFLVAYLGYAFFKVFIGGRYFTYHTYHSVFGSI